MTLKNSFSKLKMKKMLERERFQNVNSVRNDVEKIADVLIDEEKIVVGLTNEEKGNVQENLKNKKLSHDDLACILYILYKTQQTPYYNSMKCVLIDEAQDLSELMFIALRGVFCNATFGVFGDIAQGIYSYQSIDEWNQVQNIFDNTQLLYLKRSYRTSIEIMEEANKILVSLGIQPAQNIIRHGDPVEIINNNSIDTIKSIIEKNSDKYAHIAVICSDDNELNFAQEELKTLNLTVIKENNSSYDNHKNILLTTQTAKGLEFDCVIIYNRNSYKNDTMGLRMLYVAETRALHKLIICNSNT